MQENKISSVALTIHKSADTTLPETIIDKYISDRFSFGIGNIEIHKVKEYISHLQKKFPSCEMIKFEVKSGRVQYFFQKKETEEKISDEIEDFFIFVMQLTKDKAYLEIFGKKPKEVELLYNDSRKFIDENSQVVIQMHNFYLEDKLSTDTTYLSKEDIKEIRQEYYPDFISTDLFFEQYTNAKENIVVLSGESGVGKSKFSTLLLRYMLDNAEEFDLDEDYEGEIIKVAYVKNERILSLDSFWINLRNMNYQLVILDDLDYFLSPRQQSVSSELEVMKNQFISQFLSFTDGLVPNKTKFLISTNRDIDSIDEALLRDGRMFGVFSFSKLKKDEALAIWKKEKLKVKDFEIEFGNFKEILQATLGSTIHEYKQNNNKKAKPFLKEDSKADISSKFKSKKVGFSVS